jgi:hypothetical protein
MADKSCENSAGVIHTGIAAEPTKAGFFSTT